MKHSDKNRISGNTDRKSKLMSGEKMGELMQNGVSPDRSCISTSNPETFCRRRSRGAGGEEGRGEAGRRGEWSRRRSEVRPPAGRFSFHTIDMLGLERGMRSWVPVVLQILTCCSQSCSQSCRSYVCTTRFRSRFTVMPCERSFGP